jgi:hypothetical protein
MKPLKYGLISIALFLCFANTADAEMDLLNGSAYTERNSSFYLIFSETQSQFNCRKKQCKDMISCEEACYKFKVCKHQQLDRDKDGIPCESICSSRCS